MTTIKKQILENHLNEYLQLTHQNDDGNGWIQFFNKNRSILDSTEKYFHSKTNISEDILLSFHDGFFKNIQANNTNTFNVSLLTYQYQKIDEDDLPNSYQEIEPIYLNFNLDNKFINTFRKLTQMNDVLHLIYDGENLGLIILNKKHKQQSLIIESIDLSHFSVTPVEKKVKKFKP